MSLLKLQDYSSALTCVEWIALKQHIRPRSSETSFRASGSCTKSRAGRSLPRSASARLYVAYSDRNACEEQQRP